MTTMCLDDLAQEVGTLHEEQESVSHDREVTDGWEGPDDEITSDMWDPQA